MTERTVYSVERIRECVQLICEKGLRDLPDYTDKITSIDLCKGLAADQIRS